MESRLTLDRERLLETEVLRTETRLEAENFSTRMQVARAEGELFRTENEVSRIAGTVESLSFRLAAEREAREVEDRSLRECVEDLVEALKENMAKLTSDMENIKITVREDTANSSGRAQRQAMEMIDGQLQAALRALEDRFRDEMRLEHKALRDGFRTAQELLADDLARMSSQLLEHRGTYRTSLVELESRLREDLVRVSSPPPRSPLEALAGDRVVDRALVETMVESKMSFLQNEYRAAIEASQQALEDELRRVELLMEDRTKSAGDGGELRAVGALEEVRWREETDRLLASHRDFQATFEDERARQRRGAEELEVKLRAEMARTVCELRSGFAGGELAGARGDSGDLRVAHDALEARLMDELSGQHGRLQGQHRSGLQSLEADLREEVLRVSDGHNKSHSALRDMIAEHRSEIDGSYLRISNASRLAVSDVDAKVEELRAQSMKIESLQRAAIQTLGEELRDEMVRSQRGQRGGLAADDFDARLETHAARVEAQLRQSTKSVDEMLRLEIERLDGEHLARYATLEGLLSECRREVDDLGRRSSGQMSDSVDRQDMEQLRSEVEELLSACRQLGSQPPMPAAANLDGMEDLMQRSLAGLVENVSFEDGEGRRWQFHHPRDCLEHMGRRLGEINCAIAREQKLREENFRNLQVQTESLQDPEQRAQKDEALRSPAPQLARDEGRAAQKDEAQRGNEQVESQSRRFADRLSQRQDEDSSTSDTRRRRGSREAAEERAEQQLRRTESQLRSEQSTLRRVENELAAERELELERDEKELENLEGDLQEVSSIPRISVVDVGGLSSSVASSTPGSAAGGGGSVMSTPVTKAGSRVATPLTTTAQKRTTTAARSVSPGSRARPLTASRSADGGASTSATLQSSRSANGLGSEAPSARGSQIVAGPAQSARVSAASSVVSKAPEKSGVSSTTTLKSRMAGGSSRPSASPGPARSSSTMKGSVRARPAT